MPLTFLPTPLGNLEDITFRSLRAIGESEVVFCEDSRVAKKLFMLLSERFDIDISQKKFYPLHSHNENDFLQNVDTALFDKKCIYVSDAGMPCISDPGAMLVRFAREHKIAYDVLPGASAVTTLYAASGFLDTKFVFYGFLPHKTTSRIEELQKLAENEYPIIFYEAPHRILQFFEEVASIDSQAVLFAAKEISKLHQKYFSFKACEYEEVFSGTSLKGEWSAVVKFSKQGKGSISLTLEELLELEIPKKQLSKLISRLTGENPKSVYENLIQKSH